MALANGDLSTQAKVDDAEAAKVGLDETKLSAADKAKVAAADAKVAAAKEAVSVPTLAGANATSKTKVEVTFSKAVDAVSACKLHN